MEDANFTTELSIANLDASFAASASLVLMGDDGRTVGTQAQRSIPPRGRIVIYDPGAFGRPRGGGPTEGYVLVNSSGPLLAGSVVFGDPARSGFATALPLASRTQRDVVFSKVAQDDLFFTGAAIIHLSDQPSSSLVEVFDSHGQRVGSGAKVLPARGRDAFVLTELFPGLNISAGYFLIRSDRDMASFAIFGTHTLGALAAIPPQNTPSEGAGSTTTSTTTSTTSGTGTGTTTQITPTSTTSTITSTTTTTTAHSTTTTTAPTTLVLALPVDIGLTYDAVTKTQGAISYDSPFVIGFFGETLPRHPETVRGMEFYVSTNAVVRAATDGTVTRASPDLIGNRLKIEFNAEYWTEYLNLGELSVNVGETVRAGQPIGVASPFPRHSYALVEWLVVDLTALGAYLRCPWSYLGLNEQARLRSVTANMAALGLRNVPEPCTDASRPLVVPAWPPRPVGAEVQRTFKWLENPPAANAPMTYPAVSNDEKALYLGNNASMQVAPENNGQNAFYAIDTADGKVIWRYPLGNLEVKSAASVAADGTIYFILVSRAWENFQSRGSAWLYALDPQGTFKWSYPLIENDMMGGYARAIPAIGSDGTIYVGANALFAFEPNGQLKWKLSTDKPFWHAPTIGPDGTIYVTDRVLRAISPAGQQKWTVSLAVDFSMGSWAHDSPSIAPDGNLFAFSDECTLMVLRPDGTEQWRFDVAKGEIRAIKAPPAIGADGTVYFGTKVAAGTQVQVFALHPDGRIKWIFEPWDNWISGANDIYDTPLLGADGTIYLGGEFHYYYALRPDGTVTWKFGPSIEPEQPVLLRNGVLIVSDQLTTLYALRTQSMGLQSAPWPILHKNNQNTGR